jgi:hypothetical protein
MGLEGPFENFGEIKNQLENPQRELGQRGIKGGVTPLGTA